MSVREELLFIEETLWFGGAPQYRRALDADCLLAFTQKVGVSSREEIAETVGGTRWHDVDIDVEGLLQPTDDVAILTYRGSAVRGADAHYKALVSSGYVKRPDGWKMMFHQQTPLAT